MATIKNPTIRHFLTGVVFISLQAMLSAAEEGTLITPANMPITAQGKQIGKMTLPAGTKVQVMRQEGAKTLIKTSMGETWIESDAISTGKNPIPKTADTPIPQPSPAIALPLPSSPTATPSVPPAPLISEAFLEEAKTHIQSTKMDARIQEMLDIDGTSMEWSMWKPKAGWLYFSARSNQPIWTFAACTKVDLKEIEGADLQGDFVQKGENEKIQSIFDPENESESDRDSSRDMNAIPVRENQIILAKRIDEPKIIYALRLTDQSGPGKEQISAEYLTIPLDAQAAQKPARIKLAPIKAVPAETPPTDPLVSPAVWAGGPLPGQWEETASGPNWQIKEWVNPEPFFGAMPLTGKAEYRDGKLAKIDLAFIDRFGHPLDQFNSSKGEIEELKKKLDALYATYPRDAVAIKQARTDLDKSKSQYVNKGFFDGVKARSDVIQSLAGQIRRAFSFKTIGASPNLLGDDNVIIALHGNSELSPNFNYTGVSISRRYPASDAIKAVKPDAGDGGAEFLSRNLWDRKKAEFPDKLDKPLLGVVPEGGIYPDGYYEGGDESTRMASVSVLRSRLPSTPKANAFHRAFESAQDAESAAAALKQEREALVTETRTSQAASMEKYLAAEKTMVANLLAYFPATPENSAPAARVRKFSNDDFDAALLADIEGIHLVVIKKKRSEQPASK